MLRQSGIEKIPSTDFIVCGAGRSNLENATLKK